MIQVSTYPLFYNHFWDHPFIVIHCPRKLQKAGSEEKFAAICFKKENSIVCINFLFSNFGSKRLNCV